MKTNILVSRDGSVKKSLRQQHPVFVCNLCGDGKDLQTISPGGGRERENSLIQEIPRQTKTELLKWRRDPRGSLFGTSLWIMTLLCYSSVYHILPRRVCTTYTCVPHTCVVYKHTLCSSHPTKNDKSQCQSSRDKIYMCVYYCYPYEWQASLFDNDNLS